jgi:hypothetical protein
VGQQALLVLPVQRDQQVLPGPLEPLEPLEQLEQQEPTGNLS